jgi:hypothetical protein
MKMKYDDASWHSGGNFPKDLLPDAAFTHTGLYLAWAVLSGLASKELQDEELAKLTARLTPSCQVYRAIDGKLTDEDLSDEGNAFTKVYFDFEVWQYLKDYGEILCEGLPTMYHVADSWENYERLSYLQNCSSALNYWCEGIFEASARDFGRCFRDEARSRIGRGYASVELSIKNLGAHSRQSFPVADGGARAAH